jgi:hypothetical protein
MYKIYLILLTFFISNQFAHAQNVQYNSFIEFHENTQFNRGYNVVDSYALKLNLKSIHLEIKEGQKKPKYYSQEMHFDNNGRAHIFYSYNDTFKSEILKKLTSVFDENNHLINEVYYNNSYGFTAVSNYNDSNLLLNRFVYNKKNKLSSKRIYAYNLNGNIISTHYYDSKNKMISNYQYSYFPDGKLKQTVFTYKNKTKVWDYSCDETGKIMDKPKDTIKICTTKSYLSDGKIVSTTQGYTWNGKPYKYIRVSDSFDNEIEVSYFENVNEELVYRVLYSYIGKVQVNNIYKSYSKGKMTYKTETTRDIKGRVIKSASQSFSNAKPKALYSTLYHYQNNGLIAKKIYFKNNSEYKHCSYQYIFYK